MNEDPTYKICDDIDNILDKFYIVDPSYTGELLCQRILSHGNSNLTKDSDRARNFTKDVQVLK